MQTFSRIAVACVGMVVVATGLHAQTASVFVPVTPCRVADTRLVIATWRYRAQDSSVRHMGPVAQDFRAAFSLGEDERTIAMVDADGVALAAVQGLYAMVKEGDGEIAALERRNADLEARLTRLEEAARRP